LSETKDIQRVFVWDEVNCNFIETIPGERRDGICVTFDGVTGKIKSVESLYETN